MKRMNITFLLLILAIISYTLNAQDIENILPTIITDWQQLGHS